MAIPLTIPPTAYSELLQREDSPAPIKGAIWHRASSIDQTITYRIKPGALVGANWIYADLLLDGDETAVFQLHLHETASKLRFDLQFSLLNQCGARLRMPMSAVEQNRWSFNREGACLKLMAFGDRVNPAKVDQLTIRLLRKGDFGGVLDSGPAALGLAERFPQDERQPAWPREAGRVGAWHIPRRELPSHLVAQARRCEHVPSQGENILDHQGERSDRECNEHERHEDGQRPTGEQGLEERHWAGAASCVIST